MSESRTRRWWQAFRSSISVAADLWDAVKVAAFAGAVIVASLVGTALFVADVMPIGFLVMFVVGVIGLASVLLVPVAQRVLPKATGRARAVSQGSPPVVDGFVA